MMESSRLPIEAQKRKLSTAKRSCRLSDSTTCPMRIRFSLGTSIPVRVIARAANPKEARSHRLKVPNIKVTRSFSVSFLPGRGL